MHQARLVGIVSDVVQDLRKSGTGEVQNSFVKLCERLYSSKKSTPDFFDETLTEVSNLRCISLKCLDSMKAIYQL